MTDEQLADEIIARLNAMIQDPAVRADIIKLLDVRVPVSVATADHPTIQVLDGKMGTLGFLNGIVGVIPSGEKKDWGYITAVFDDDGDLAEFRRTT